MKRVLEVFTEEEFKKLKELKGNATWHDFIMLLTDIETLSQWIGLSLIPIEVKILDNHKFQIYEVKGHVSKEII